MLNRNAVGPADKKLDVRSAQINVQLRTTKESDRGIFADAVSQRNAASTRISQLEGALQVDSRVSAERRTALLRHRTCQVIFVH